MNNEELDLDDLERMAQAQKDAYARMLEIGEGVGGLGVYHPEMFKDMIEWDDSSESEHSDTVLALIARIREAGDTISQVTAVIRGFYEDYETVPYVMNEIERILSTYRAEQESR